MPQPHTLKISEIFASVQGEGLRQGEATLFVRLTGCNLKCAFCDTKYAWKGGEDLDIEQILNRLEQENKRLPADWVCLTGGEPLMQDVGALSGRLKERGKKIQVETNATLYQDLSVDWYTLSPKPPAYFFQPEYREKAREVKLVVSKELTYEVVLRLRNKFPQKTPILLQPESNLKWSREKGMTLLEGSQTKGLENIRISVQLHKIYEIK